MCGALEGVALVIRDAFDAPLRGRCRAPDPGRSHSLDRLDTAFDDDRLVADAGLLLPP